MTAGIGKGEEGGEGRKYKKWGEEMGWKIREGKEK